jgi:hypothetical protein
MLGVMPRTHSRESQPTICCRRTGPYALAVGGLGGARSLDAGQGFQRRPAWEGFRKVLLGLRELCPPAKPVIVRTSWLPRDVLGECRRSRARFVVRLNNQLRQDQAIETLLHEWAHALAWNYSLDRLARTPGVSPEMFDAASHDEAWGCAYSRVWRVYLELGG